MSTKTTIPVRLLTASILVATALPVFASDKQDRNEALRLRQTEQVNVGRYPDSNRYGRYQDASPRPRPRCRVSDARVGLRVESDDRHQPDPRLP